MSSCFSGCRTVAPFRERGSLARLIAGLALLVMQAIPGLSQSVTATVRGRVLDPTGSVIIGARVSVVNQETGVIAWTGTSEGAGNYVAPQIPIGTYSITAQHPGFKKTKIADVMLTVEQRAGGPLAQSW
jgi:hypothetical protein